VKLWKSQSTTKTSDEEESMTTSLWDRFFDSPLFSVATGDTSAAMDIIEREKEYEIRVAAPGATKDIDVNVEGTYLNIEVCRETETPGSDTMLMRGIKDFCFKRRVSLENGKIDLTNIKSIYKNGILTITLPKTAEVQMKKIPVSVE
jgi:HSP20 family protein